MISEYGIVRIFLVIFVLIFFLQAIFPEYAWRIEHGMPKDVEPSDGGILLTRIGGIFCAILGVIFFFATLS